jgi:hypothetical protein
MLQCPEKVFKCNGILKKGFDEIIEYRSKHILADMLKYLQIAMEYLTHELNRFSLSRFLLNVLGFPSTLCIFLE